MNGLLLAGILTMGTGTALAIRADAAPPPHAGPWRIVGVGDSVASKFFPLIEGDTYLNYEVCRAPYVSGCPGFAWWVVSGTTSVADVSWSAVEAMAYMRDQVGRGSDYFFIVQEGGYADRDLVVTTDEVWRTFLDDVLMYTSGVCLLFVLPADGRPGDIADAARRRAEIARAVLDDYPHRCIHVIDWWAAAHSDPDLLSSGGYHPSPAGAEWLAGQINAIVQ